MKFPTYNPFESRAVSTIELSTGTDRDLLNLARQPVEQVAALVSRFAKEWQTLDDPGRAVAVVGAFGSGKTHTLKNALQSYLATRGDPNRPYVVYVRLDDPRTGATFRKLVGAIPKSDLIAAMSRAVAAVVGEQIAARVGDSKAAELDRLNERLLANPRLVEQLFESHDVAQTDVRAQGIQELREIRAPRDDLLRVLPMLLEPSMSDVAYSWLAGEEVTQQDLARLGVTASVSTEDMMRPVLQLIASIFRRARWPLIVALDQAEMLTQGQAENLSGPGRGFLQAVSETLPGEGALLILAMHDQAFADLGPATRIRIPDATVYRLPGLELEEAKELVRLHLAPGTTTTRDSIFPFKEDGVREILGASFGNIRRFLQACFAVFDRALPTESPIDGKFALEVLATEQWKPVTRQRAMDIVEQALRDLRLSVDRRNPEDPAHFDFVVTNALGQQQVVVEVKAAVYGADEARQAGTAIHQAKTLRSSSPYRVSFVLVVVNYSSPEVLRILRSVADEVVNADEDALHGAVKSSIKRLLGLDRGSDAATTFEALEAFQARLSQIDEARTEDRRAFEARLEDFAVRQASARYEAETDELRKLWADERAAIESRMLEAKAELIDRDIQELESLADTAEARRRKETIAAVTIAVMSSLAAFLAPAYVGMPAGALLLWLAVGLAALSWLVVAVCDRWLMGSPARDLARRVSSIEELDRLAQSDRLRRQSVIHRFARPSLHSRNPHFRFAAARMQSDANTDQLIRAMLIERSSIVRRQLVRQVVDRVGPADARLKHLLQDHLVSARDISTAVERGSIPQVAVDMWPELTILDALYDRPLGIPRRAASGVTLVERLCRNSQESPGPADDQFAALSRAHSFADEDSLRLAASLTSEREVREACQALSPFAPTGLATHYWLARVSELDELFLFFSRLRLYVSRGVRARPKS